jgi:two-component system, NarL family, sensor histidine kinase NreB
VLDDLGFEASIVWLLDRNLKEKGITCHLNMQNFSDALLTPELEITLFRIIQETSTNIARHSGAKNAFVYIKTDEKNFSMSIEDDGEGFDTASAFLNTLTGRGLGILGMKERAAHMNGSLTVCSAPGSGTVVLCKIPLSPEA